MPPILAAAAMLLAIVHTGTPPAAQAGANPCAAPEYRQFDFWIGRWDVTRPDGQRAGTNHIQRLHGGCVLMEQWQGESGLTGSSLNLYVASTRQWRQTWADSSGSLLVLEGGLRRGAMQMTGTGYEPGKAPSLNRLTWTPGADGSVRQLWEVSADEGKTWAVIFDGRYVRSSGAALR